jgi:hypothetical protein
MRVLAASGHERAPTRMLARESKDKRSPAQSSCTVVALAREVSLPHNCARAPERAGII